MRRSSIVITVIICLSALGATVGIKYCKRKKESTAKIRVQEVPNIRLAAEDPAIRGDQFNPLQPNADDPVAITGQGDISLERNMKWLPAADFDLAPNKPHLTTVPISEPTFVIARATSLGSLAPLRLTVEQAGVTLESRNTIPIPPDRGIVMTRVEVNPSGNVNISVVNEGKESVRVQAVVGTVAVASGKEKP
jgi:hypothetical protein